MPQQQPVRRTPNRRRQRRNNRKTLLFVIILFLLILLCIFIFAKLGGKDGPSSSSQGGSMSSSSTSASGSSSAPMSTPGSSSPASNPSEEPGSSASVPASAGVNSSDWRLVMASAAHPLGKDYSVDLEVATGNYKVDARIREPLMEMIAAAKADGVSLAITSAHRTVQRQTELYDAKVNEYIGYGYSQSEAEAEAAKWVAPPGTSEHNTGLALDIIYPGYYEEYGDLNENFEKSDAFAWLSEHAEEYGFVLRYPKDKQDITGITYEPWHYRYVGVENAKAMNAAHQCLEEYLGLA
ncbi:M15 family metallopeptidase [Zongyangia hominis]|uniref:M15 family metallopeptidase n=1 Tax=Zongyangia hominis TaxID=2763677 RepID=A0A926EC52_9FIRM|nr:M15 family metallopeptidase [Zongyangia hominis]MBC8570370.1 M15 family metallopeptidase [Zongyangia hominis]